MKEKPGPWSSKLRFFLFCYPLLHFKTSFLAIKLERELLIQYIFIQVRDKVKKGQVVCIIEAMKLMNEIEVQFSPFFPFNKIC
jgi:Biotin-requiring enzyme